MRVLYFIKTVNKMRSVSLDIRKIYVVDLTVSSYIQPTIF